MDIFAGTFLDRFEDAVIATLHQTPLASMGLLFIEEAGIPIPVPGDIVIAYTGYQVSKGIFPYPVAFIFLLIAVLAGSSILYYLSKRFGQTIVLKFGKYLHVNERRLAFVEEKFRKYGPWVIILGRHIPGFRVPITIFAGMSGISYKTFILSTFISILFWIPFYLSLGNRLGPKTATLFHAHPQDILLLIIPLALLLLGYFFVRINPKYIVQTKIFLKKYVAKKQLALLIQKFPRLLRFAQYLFILICLGFASAASQKLFTLKALSKPEFVNPYCSHNFSHHQQCISFLRTLTQGYLYDAVRFALIPVILLIAAGIYKIYFEDRVKKYLNISKKTRP